MQLQGSRGGWGSFCEVGERFADDGFRLGEFRDEAAAPEIDAVAGSWLRIVRLRACEERRVHAYRIGVARL